MAKCVKMFDGQYEDRVIRVPDRYALKLVGDGRAEYSPREPWKVDRISPKGRV
jgi:hypothetical protein